MSMCRVPPPPGAQLTYRLIFQQLHALLTKNGMTEKSRYFKKHGFYSIVGDVPLKLYQKSKNTLRVYLDSNENFL